MLITRKSVLYQNILCHLYQNSINEKYVQKIQYTMSLVSKHTFQFLRIKTLNHDFNLKILEKIELVKNIDCVYGVQQFKY